MARPPKPPDRQSSPRFKLKKGLKKGEKGMAPKSQVMKALRALISRPGTHLETGEYHEQVSLGYGGKGVGAGRHRNDRGAALLLAANLENSLQIAIERRLAIAETYRTILFVDEASPLRRFSAKIRLGYALGLFGDGLKSNLDLVRMIRNVFAHALSPVHFSTPEVMGACAHLTMLVPVEASKVNPADPKTVGQERFTLVCERMSAHLRFVPPATDS
jgi:hypothetical protein